MSLYHFSIVNFNHSISLLPWILLLFGIQKKTPNPDDIDKLLDDISLDLLQLRVYDANHPGLSAFYSHTAEQFHTYIRVVAISFLGKFIWNHQSTL